MQRHAIAPVAIAFCAAALLASFALRRLAPPQCHRLCTSPSDEEMLELFVDDALTADYWQTRVWHRQPSDEQARVAAVVASATLALYGEPAAPRPGGGSAPLVSARLNRQRGEEIRGTLPTAAADGWTQVFNTVENREQHSNR